MSSQDYEITLSGYHGTNYASPLLVVTDHILSDGTAINAANIAYPPSTFTGFLTDMMIRESYTSDLQWFYHVAGDIPSQFKKIDAAVNSVNALNGSASLNLTGTFKMTEVNWQFVDFAHTLFDWHIFGPDTTKTLTLPVLSEGLAKLFPTLAADSLTCMSVEISNYPNLSNYQEILKMKFDPTRSKLPGDFEVNSVKKILSGKK